MKKKKKSKTIIPKLNTFGTLDKIFKLKKGTRIGKIFALQRIQRYLRPILNLIKNSTLHKRPLFLVKIQSLQKNLLKISNSNVQINEHINLKPIITITKTR